MDDLSKTTAGLQSVELNIELNIARKSVHTKTFCDRLTCNKVSVINFDILYTMYIYMDEQYTLHLQILLAQLHVGLC